MLESESIKNNNIEVLSNFNRIPYSLINAEVEGSATGTLEELSSIVKYYKIYENGADFDIEGTNGDYIGSDLKYKSSRALINKEARFLFGEAPSIKIEAKGDIGKIGDESKDALTTLNDLITTILDDNNFEDKLVKGAKDCFIGKRVACLANFNNEDGVTVQFIPSTQFLYDTKLGNNDVLTKFICFIIIKESTVQAERRIFKKKYELDESGNVWLEEILYDGAGVQVEEVTKRRTVSLKRIPAVIIANDGLTGNTDGESEIETLNDYESWYSKLSNGDIDAERKSMNPIKYTIDMDTSSTKDLRSSAGSYWDLLSDQNLDNPHPSVGALESSMGYSSSLDTTLKRLKTTQYEQVDMPNVTLESLQGAITSGKSLKAIYWGLIVRCKEKMKVWGPQLQTIIDIIIEGAFAYEDCIKRYITDPLTQVAYKITIDQKMPLPEDEVEQKTVDLAEVQANTMSKKAYMKKWRDLTDEEVDEEIRQIAYERQMIEDNFMPGVGNSFTTNTNNEEQTDDNTKGTDDNNGTNTNNDDNKLNS